MLQRTKPRWNSSRWSRALEEMAWREQAPPFQSIVVLRGGRQHGIDQNRGERRGKPKMARQFAVFSAGGGENVFPQDIDGLSHRPEKVIGLDRRCARKAVVEEQRHIRQIEIEECFRRLNSLAA